MLEIASGTLFKYTSIGLGLACLGLAIALWVAGVRIDSLKNDVQELANWQDNIVQVVQTASGNPETDKDSADDQITAMGASIDTLVGGIAAQNDAIDRISDERDEALARAEQERQRRAAAVAQARDAIAELEAMERAPPAMNTEEAVRAAQDIAYEEGV